MWHERGLTMVFVTHDSTVARRAQRIGVMKNGRLGFRRPGQSQAARSQAARSGAAGSQAAPAPAASAQATEFMAPDLRRSDLPEVEPEHPEAEDHEFTNLADLEHPEDTDFDDVSPSPADASPPR
jgi:ABC-type oligopeptide transport system ATPase subunit